MQGQPIKRVIVVYKKSSYELYAIEKRDKHFLNLIEQNDPSVSQFIPSHQEHHKNIDRLKKYLEDLGVQSKFVHRARKFHEDWADLIITIGGDGTFLDAARHTVEKPMLGINSDPKRSVGMYCGITVDQFLETFKKIEQGTLEEKKISRLQLTSENGIKAPPVLNDVLIANLNPASVSRMKLVFGQESYDYKSSGLWVSTPSGSTGAMRSTGGDVLPLEAETFMCYVRENYHAPNEIRKPSRILLHKGEVLSIYSRMRQGTLFLDGAHKKTHFYTGDRLDINLFPHKLRVYAYDESRRSQFIESEPKRRSND